MKGEKKALADEATLASTGVVDNGELEIKDLGPQLSWTTVFLVEYVCDYVLFLLARLRPYLLGWPSHCASPHILLPQTILWRRCATQFAAEVRDIRMF